MSLSVVFLDRDTIGPGVHIRPPAFAHVWRDYARTPVAQVLDHIGDADIVISNKVKLDATVLEQLPGLKLIAIAATGYDIVDLHAAAAAGIGVCNIRGYAVNAVPEHVFAMALALRRNLFQYRAEVLAGAWQRAGQFCFFNRPLYGLHGAVLGIVGCGALGQATARLGAAFGMQVQFLDEHSARAPAGATLLPRTDLFRSSDIISLHCPLTAETRGMVNASLLQQMKADAVIINTARGGLIDEEALALAIETGQIGGAGIDVLSQEPPPLGHPLLRLATRHNVLLTPHIAWASVEAMQTLCDQLVDNLEAFIAGRPRNTLIP